jgi:hypothetical protein
MSNTIGTGLGVGVMVAGGILLSTWVGGAMGVGGILGGIKSKLSNLTKIERTVVKETGKKKNILNAADDALPDPNKARINPNSVDELPPNGKKPLSTENLSDTENPNLHPDGTRPLDIDPENNKINPNDPNESRLADLKRRQAEQNTLRDEQKRKQDELARNEGKGKQPQPSQQQQGLFDRKKKDDGDKHKGLYDTYVNKSESELMSAIRSYDAQIEIHRNLLNDPKKYLAEYGKGDWDSLDSRQQDALLGYKWLKDIERLEEQKRIMQTILDGRK